MQEMEEIWVRSPGREDPLEEGAATHSSILAWRIPWTEELGGLQSMGSQRVRHNWVTNTFISSHTVKKIFLKSRAWITCISLKCFFKSFVTSLQCFPKRLLYYWSVDNLNEKVKAVPLVPKATITFLRLPRSINFYSGKERKKKTTLLWNWKKKKRPTPYRALVGQDNPQVPISSRL